MAEAAKQAVGAPALLNVIADAGYSNGEQAEHCEGQGIVPHVPANRAVNNKGDGTLFDRSQFQYDENTDTFRCPAGQRLVRKQLARKDRAVIYAGRAEVCGSCPLKTRCTLRNASSRDICTTTLWNECSSAPRHRSCGCDDPRSSIRSPRSSTESSDTRASCCAERTAHRPKSA
jgi:hypothetical protein